MSSASFSFSSPRGTTMSIMPCSSRYSARWKPFGQLLADGLLDHPLAGKADQRAGLGDLDVAEHRVGRGDAAGGRVGQDDDVGQAGLLELGQRDGRARHLHQRLRMPSCMRAPPAAVNRM